MYKKFHVIGLQRTGTNWLNQLILNNFHVEQATPTDTFWKHLTPAGTKWIFQRNLRPWPCTKDDLHIKDDIFYIATSKEWDIFQESINRNAEDLPQSHNKIGTNDPRGTLRVYNMWFEWAKDQEEKPNFFWKDYMDWLHNWEYHFARIEKITGWKRKNKPFLNVDYVPQSEDFDISNYIMKDSVDGKSN